MIHNISIDEDILYSVATVGSRNPPVYLLGDILVFTSVRRSIKTQFKYVQENLDFTVAADARIQVLFTDSRILIAMRISCPDRQLIPRPRYS